MATEIIRPAVAVPIAAEESSLHYAVAQATTAGIAVVDREGRQTYVNPAFCRMVGWTQEELVGGVVPYAYWPIEAHSIIQAAFEAALQGAAPPEGFVLPLCRANGERFPAHVSPAPLLDPAGNGIGWVATIVDITERKQREEAVLALNERLERAMRETHHRVKNNLQVIMALINLLTVNYENSVPIAELERITHHIRALAAIHDLLTQQAREDPQVMEVSIGAALDRLLTSLRDLVANRPLQAQVEDVRLPVRYTTSLTIVVNELVANAIKHGDGEISLGFSAGDNTARLTVADRGRGFPPDFDASVASHTGLELVESLARWDLNGEIVYSNGDGSGATVTVTFPLPQRPAIPEESRPV